MSADIIAELARLHHRATDLRAREAQLADAGENDPASDTWKTAAIVAASAECEFEAALVEAWPALDRILREADQWRARESETQEALQAIGEEFGILGGEPRVDGIRRVLAEKEKALALAGATLMKLDQTNAELQARVLREAAEGCAPKEEPKSYWGWWAGANEEWCTIGPCSSRDQVIAEATDEVLGEFQDGDTWKLGFHICEANKPPLRLADWIGADDLLGQAEDAICDSDRVSCEYDEGPWFHASAEQEADLERRIKAACDAWQAAHGLVFTCTSFSSSRNHEHVVVPHPLAEPTPPARIEDSEEPSHG